MGVLRQTWLSPKLFATVVRGDVWEALQCMSFYVLIIVRPVELLTLQLRAWPVRRSPRW